MNPQNRMPGCPPGALVLAGLALALLAAAPPLHGQSGGLWRPEDRVLITAFHELGAVATDLRRVYGASINGLEVYDFVAGRWESPLTHEDGYPAGERPTALAYDPVLDVLWLATEAGALYSARIHAGRWERETMVMGGPVLQIIVDRSAAENALYLEVPGGWLRLGHGSFIPERVLPRDVPPAVLALGGSPLARLARSDRYLDIATGTITLDRSLRRWPITDIAPADRPARYWIATNGGNLIFFDSRLTTAEPRAFGLLTTGVSALAADGDRIWFGGDGSGARRGVSVGDVDLQEWRLYEAGYEGAPAGPVLDILPTGAAVWVAALDGVYRFGRAESRWRRLSDADGRPATEAGALASSRDGVWVGTRRGLAFLPDSGGEGNRTFFRGTAVRGLVSSRDTLWISSDAGLWLLPPGAQEPVRPPGAAAQPALAGRILDARPAFESVFVLAEDAVYRFDGGAWHGPTREPVQAGLGRLLRMAAADGQIWVAGENGVGRMDPGTGTWTFHLVGQDIPVGPVRDVLPAGKHFWAATPAGAWRIVWRR